MFKTSIIALLLLAFPAAGALAQELTPFAQTLESEGFEEIDQEFGVKAYKDPDSDVIRIAAQGRFAAKPKDVFRAVLDYENQVGKIKRVSETRILEKGPGWMLVYQRLNLPIISDRDYTLYVTWGAEGDILWVNFRSSYMGPEERDGIVRVIEHYGSWQMKPVANGRYTLARFQVRIDLAGSLPKWLARSGAGDELPELFQNVRRMLVGQNQDGGECYSKAC
jgi:hypothetical protein